MIKKLLYRITNNKKLLLFTASIIVMFVIVMVGINLLLVNKSNTNNKDVDTNVVQKIDQMENYDYYLDDNATNYYKELYGELKNILNNEIVNEEEYAKIVSKLFVTDLFTLDNKITSNDVGGLQFIFTGFRDDFVNIAKTTLYSSVESNIYGNRNQELPIVQNVQINSISKSSFTYQSNNYDSYNVILNITYEKDLGYPNDYSLSLIKNDRYIQVASAK